MRVAPDQTLMTRLARLSPISNALADSDQQMSVMVMDDKNIYIGALDGKTPLAGAEITVSGEGVAEKTMKTDGSGYIELPMRNYPSDRDGEAKVNIKVSLDGYRSLEANGIYIKKGSIFKVPTGQDDGTPYPVSWSFWGNDMYLTEYELLISPYNDSEQEIAIKIASGQNYTLSMYFTDSKGGNRLNVGTASGKPGTQTHTFSSQWLKNAPADGKLYAEITPQGGSTVTYQAMIKLIAPTLKKAIGDPNFKLLNIDGLQFTLPSSWPKPLGGLTIAINPPLGDKFKVRAYFDLNGNGAITIGTTAFDDMVKAANNGLWKSQDKKTMDKKAKENEEKGLKAKAKAAAGGDWEGRSKWSPFKLGSISLSMSWFGYAQVQYQETEDDYGQIFGKGGAGFTVSLSGEAGLQWPIVRLTLTATLSATLFPEIGVKIDTYWPEGQFLPTVKSLDYVLGSFNIIIRLELALTLTLGIKGFLSVSVTGLGFLEFQIRLTLGFDIDQWIKWIIDGGGGDGRDYGKKDIDFKIYGGASFFVVLEVLWTKSTYFPFGPQWRWRLYPGPVERADSVTPQTPVDRFLAYLLSTASAEEDIGETQGGMQVDTGNEDLALEGKELSFHPTEITVSSAHRLFTMRSSGEVEEDTPAMLFMIPGLEKSYTAVDGRCRYSQPALIFKALTSDDEFTPLAKTYDDLDQYGRGDLWDNGYDVIDYDYWVQDVSGANVYTYDRGNEEYYKLNDVLFVVSMLAKDYEEKTITYDDGTTETRKTPKETWAMIGCYYLYRADDDFWSLKPVVLAPDQKWVSAFEKVAELEHPGMIVQNPCYKPKIVGTILANSEESLAMYRVLFASVNSLEDGSDYRPWEIMGYKTSKGQTYRYSWFLRDANWYFEDCTYEDLVFFFDQISSDPHDVGSGNEGRTKFYIRNSTMSFFLAKEKDGDTLYELNYIPSTRVFRGLVQTGLKVYSMAVTQKDDENMSAFFVQPDEDGEGCSLKWLRVEHSGKTTLRQYSILDFGIHVPPTQIYWASLYGRECVYWAETAGQTEDGKHQLFQVKAAWLDRASGTLSDTFTIATLKTPNGVAPTQISLGGNDTGYYLLADQEGKVTAYTFNFQLVPGIKLVGNVLTETLVTPGAYDDMILTLYNNGNIPLTGLDLAVYEQKKDGSAEAFETIHLDVLHPENNRVTLKKGMEGNVEEKQGWAVARQEESSLNPEGTNYWLVEKTTIIGKDRVEKESSLKKTELIMPGTFAAFNISLLLPNSWTSSHSIYLQVDKFYTTASSSFSGNAYFNAPPVAAETEIISIGRDGTVQQEGGEEQTNYSALFKTDLTFDTIGLSDKTADLEIVSRRWNSSDGTPMVTLTVTNQRYVAEGERRSNAVVMEAFLDEETTPVFRYSLPDEVSDTETWNFDLPLSLLTDGRSAGKVTVKVGGKNYVENGEFDNSTVIYLEPEAMTILTQPQDVNASEGGGAEFSVAVSGGRAPLKYQWQAKTPKGSWEDMPGETAAALTLKAVTLDMSGNQYRVTVTDASDYTVTSRAAALTVKKVPHTGDDAPVIWWIAGTALALAGIAYVIIKRKKEQHEKTV